MWRVDLLAADICSYLFKLNPRFLRSYLSVCLSAIFIFQTVNMSVIKVCVCSFFFMKFVKPRGYYGLNLNLSYLELLS